LPDGDWPVELYVPETTLVDFIDRYTLEMAGEQTVDVILRAEPAPWPFPPHLRVVPEIVAALDLTESLTPALVELGRARLKELGDGLEPALGAPAATAQAAPLTRALKPTPGATPPAVAALRGRRRGLGRPRRARRPLPRGAAHEPPSCASALETSSD
jgi:hypothetical protein